MRMPAWLENLVVPAARIAEFSVFNRFHRAKRIDDFIRQKALHETAHAVAWALSGGTLEKTTIVPGDYEGCFLWGFAKYDLPAETSTQELRRRAFSGMGSSAFFELVGILDIDGTMDDLESSVEDLPVHLSRSR